jgi:23S rRNA pseudouridine1911/1915/1917 synthase
MSPPDAVPDDATTEHRLDLPSALAGGRLDAVLAQLLPLYSRARIAQWIDAGAVLLDGRRVERSARVSGGETVVVTAQFPVDTTVRAEEPVTALRIVHRDRSLYVIDKPAGLVVHPGAGNRSGTLQNALLALEPALARVPRAGIVHRLDKDTSGLLLVARTAQAHAALVGALAAHEVRREYLALCMGVVSGGGTVDEPIGRHRTQRTRMAVRADGREAVTHYRIERRLGAHTLLRVQLETGRTHQIRVHLAHIGHPIVGDPVYGGRRRLAAGLAPGVRDALLAFPRQALHATRLSLAHPTSGTEIEFDSPLPEDMAGLIRALAAAPPVEASTARRPRSKAPGAGRART